MGLSRCAGRVRVGLIRSVHRLSKQANAMDSKKGPGEEAEEGSANNMQPARALPLLCTRVATPPGNDDRITKYNIMRNDTLEAVREAFVGRTADEAVDMLRDRLLNFYRRVWQEFDAWDCYGLRDPPVREEYETAEASETFACPDPLTDPECLTRAAMRELRNSCALTRPWLAHSGIRDELMEVLLETKPAPEQVTHKYRSFRRGVFDGSLFRTLITEAFENGQGSGVDMQGCGGKEEQGRAGRVQAESVPAERGPAESVPAESVPAESVPAEQVRAEQVRAERVLRRIIRASQESTRAGSTTGTAPATPRPPINTWQPVPYENYHRYSSGGVGTVSSLRPSFSGCNRLWIYEDLASPMIDTGGIPIRLASGYLVDDACKQERTQLETDDKACVANERQLDSEVTALQNDPELTAEQRRQKIKDAQDKWRIGACSSGQSASEALGKEICDKYLGIGIHLAECDCIHNQVPLLHTIARRCVDSQDNVGQDGTGGNAGYELTPQDCNRLNNRSGLPRDYKETRDVTTSNMLGRFLTRSQLNLDHAKGQDKYCIYAACSNVSPYTWKNVIKNEGIGKNCDGPQCAINIKAEWIGGDAIIENNIFELNCSKGGTNECSNNGTKNSQGNCVCNPGFVGNSCEQRVTASDGDEDKEDGGIDTKQVKAAVKEVQEAVSTTTILIIAACAVGLVILFAFLKKRSSQTSAEDQAAAADQQAALERQIAELKKMDAAVA
jgi:hypothetical protein